MLRRINDVVTNALMVFAGFWAFFLGFYICADVVARNLGIAVQGTNEIVRDSIVMMVFLQLAYCVKIGGMLRADFLAAILPKSVNRVLGVLGALTAIIFFLAVFYGAWGRPSTRSAPANSRAMARCAFRRGPRGSRSSSGVRLRH